MSLSFTTPTKITRFGRRIVPPNKDMPKPMFPPNRSTEKKINPENSLLSPKSTNSTPNSNKMQIKITDMLQKKINLYFLLKVLYQKNVKIKY